MDILTIMEVAADIEDRASQLYHLYSKRFNKNPDGYVFWEKLSREEKKHADSVRTYRRQRLELPSYHKPHPELLKELETVRKFIIQQIDQSTEDSITSALNIAYRIEGLMAHAHLSRICEIGDPLLTKLLMKLGYEDRNHQEKIRHFGWIVPSQADFPG